MNLNENDIPADLEKDLVEISQNILIGHASLMVGAGFSLNAEKKSAEVEFPTWYGLGDFLINELNKNTKCFMDNKYLNVLQIAQEYEELYGRDKLDELILELIPDDSYEPSNLHEKILSLPWKDIFTTNYDTLLERCAEAKKRYKTITTNEDIIGSSSPRIIKLHGSFPNIKPFIITMDDYRKYSNKNKMFINTIKQSLIENILVLVGFSGNDPNFLNWIYWIRENSENKNLKKVYLLTFDTPRESLLAFWEKRNVKYINLSQINKNVDKKNLLSIFIDYLTKYIEENSIKNWALEPDLQDKNIEILFDIFEKTRLKYPGWIITPKEFRNRLLKNSLKLNQNQLVYLHYLKNIDEESKIEKGYELIWRLRKALIIVPNRLFSFLNDFLLSEINITKEENHKKLYEIKLWMFRNKILNGLPINWVEQDQYFLNKYWSIRTLAEYMFEKCIYGIINLDYEFVIKTIKEWETYELDNNSFTRLLIIYFYIGEYSKAFELINKYYTKDSISCVTNIRLDLEECISEIISKSDDNTSIVNLMQNDRDIVDIKSEANDLIKKILDNRYRNGIEKKNHFNFRAYTLESSYQNIEHEFEYLNFIIEAGLLTKNKVTITESEVYLRIFNILFVNNPKTVIALIILKNNIELIDSIITRKHIYKTDIRIINELFDWLLDKLSIINFSSDFQIPILAILDILSRLLTKTNSKRRGELLDYVLEILIKYKDKSTLRKCDLFKVIAQNLTFEESKTCFNKILQHDPRNFLINFQEDLFMLLFSEIHNEDLDIKVEKFSVDQLLKYSQDPKTREYSLIRLNYLFERGLLNDRITDYYVEIWNNNFLTNGLPNYFHFNLKILIDLSRIIKITEEHKIKKNYLIYINSYKAVPQDNNSLNYIEESLNRLRSTIYFKWNSHELKKIFNYLFELWEIYYENIGDLEELDEYGIQYIHLFNEMQSIIVGLFYKNKKKSKEYLELFVETFEIKKYPCLHLLVLIKFNKDYKKSLFELKNKYKSKEYYYYEELINSIQNLLISKKSNQKILKTLLELLIEDNQINCEFVYRASFMLVQVLINNHLTKVSSSNIKLLKTLTKKLDETLNISINDPENIISDKLLAKYAYTLFLFNLLQYYNKIIKPCPSFITDWKDKTSSDDEFSEIRKIWS